MHSPPRLYVGLYGRTNWRLVSNGGNFLYSGHLGPF